MKNFFIKYMSRIMILSIFGYFSRNWINNYFNINVFFDFFNPISLIYYLIFTVFFVLIKKFIENSNNISLIFLNFSVLFFFLGFIVFNYYINYIFIFILLILILIYTLSIVYLWYKLRS